MRDFRGIGGWRMTGSAQTRRVALGVVFLAGGQKISLDRGGVWGGEGSDRAGSEAGGFIWTPSDSEKP